MTTATNTELPEDRCNIHAEGFLNFLRPIIFECDRNVVGVLQSQEQLLSQLDLVSQKIDEFHFRFRAPPLTAPIARIAQLKGRMYVLNTQLQAISERLERLLNGLKAAANAPAGKDAGFKGILSLASSSLLRTPKLTENLSSPANIPQSSSSNVSSSSPVVASASATASAGSPSTTVVAATPPLALSIAAQDYVSAVVVDDDPSTSTSAANSPQAPS